MSICHSPISCQLQPLQYLQRAALLVVKKTNSQNVRKSLRIPEAFFFLSISSITSCCFFFYVGEPQRFPPETLNQKVLQRDVFDMGIKYTWTLRTRINCGNHRLFCLQCAWNDEVFDFIFENFDFCCIHVNTFLNKKNIFINKSE